MNTTCKICNSDFLKFDRATILRKYEINYYRCASCGFVQTEEPFWMREAYTNVITNEDVGLVWRNISMAHITQNVLAFLFPKARRILDYGGGYGLLVQLMRYYGHDFYWSDQYCSNIFAKGFESFNENNSYDFLTSFEVFEHVFEPVEMFDQLFKLAPNILFSTELIDFKAPPTESWWYYGLPHGQHVSFYTRKSLEVIARKYGVRLYSHGSIHLLTKSKIPSVLFTLITFPKVAALCAIFHRRKLDSTLVK